MCKPHATISDFNANEDRMELSGAGAGQSNIQVRTDGTSTLIDLNGRTVVTLAGVTLSSSDINLHLA